MMIRTNAVMPPTSGSHLGTAGTNKGLQEHS
jgi:hypothetical protein